MPAYTFQVPKISPARIGPPVAVFRYAPMVGFQPLSTVKCNEISFREGANPSKAIFQYVTGNYLVDMVTLGFERVLPLRRIGNPYVVDTDDELVVATLGPSGRFIFLFHGYAQVPEVTLSDKQQDIIFMAQGVEARCWYEPIGYCEMRDAGDPTNPQKNRITGLDVRFNPVYKHITTGNMVTAGKGWEAVNNQGFKYCNFIDHNIDKTVMVGVDSVKVRSKWTLFNAVNYLFCTENEDWPIARTWEPPALKRILATYTPKKGDYIDIEDESTYTMTDPLITDIDVRGEPWPVAAEKLMKPAGFAGCFRLSDDGQWPVTWFDVYKLNESRWESHKDLYLQDWFEPLAPALSNVGGAKLAGDISGIINVVSVDTSPVRHEASFILAGLFDTNPADVANVATFDVAHPDFKLHSDKYRSFGFDECGEGHLEPTFAPANAEGVVTFSQLTHVFGVADLGPLFLKDENGDPLWVQRRRPPFNEMWTKDVKGQYLKAELYISCDYVGPVPCVWDGKAGTWFKVTHGWKLHDDRLGIQITHPQANSFQIFKKPVKGVVYPSQLVSGSVPIVTWMGSTDPTKRKAFTLMLVCMVESDQHLNVTAKRRPVSPTKFEVNSIVDLRDKLRPGSIHTSSYHHPNRTDPDPVIIPTGNEYDEALKYAETKREANQLGKFAGSAEIPRLSLAYRIGDRIRKIAGRDANLQINLDANGKEAPAYPRVVGLTFKLGQGMQTHLVMSDTRSDNYGI